MKAIERFIGKSILRVTVPDFDYKKHPTPHGDGAHGHGRGEARPHGGPGHGDHARTASTRPAPSSPAAPAHGRRPRREAPGAGRKRM